MSSGAEQNDFLGNAVGRGTYKVDTNRRNVALSVRVVRKSEQQARLADARVSDEKQLEKVIAAIADPVYSFSSLAACTPTIRDANCSNDMGYS